MKNKLVVLVGVIVLVFFISVSFIAGLAFGTVAPFQSLKKVAPDATKTQPLDEDLSEIREIMGQVAHGYVDNVRKEKLIDGAIDGMLKALDDPYTRHMKSKDYATFQEHTSGQFGGVGIELGMRKEQLTVIAPIKGTPADKAGVHAGDAIISIDSSTTKKMQLEKAVKLIRGEVGSQVKLSFKRGKEEFTRNITREQIKMPNVSSKVLDDDIGYIMVHAFNKDTSGDVRKELESLKEKKIKGVIVDLRNNPGGLLNEAIEMTSIFVSDKLVVQVKPRSGETQKYPAKPGGDEETPLIVLVNRGSASASEIFAGAVQDLGRGKIVGERTFGKGSVQTVIQLSDGSGLIMTTAKYMTPKGRSLHKKGVKPDVVVKLPKKDFHKTGKKDDPQILKAIELLN